jgi:hypothetical protein
VNDEAPSARHRPSPEGCVVARTERSPGFGTPLAFPVAQWRCEWRLASDARCPVTVAGPRRIYTGFRVAPFVVVCCTER